MTPDTEPALDAAGIVVVGAGQAAGEFVAALRAAGCSDQITLVGAEQHLPYSRPPLSKGYLAGELGVDDLLMRPASTYTELGVDIRCGLAVIAIDRGRRTVELEDGSVLAYTWLVLATGGRPRGLAGPLGEERVNVFGVRTMDDVDRLRTALVAGRHLLVLGGGFIGLEIGAVARTRGLRVTVVEAGDRVLSRVASPATSAFFERVHREEGVAVLTATTVTMCELDDAGAVRAVVLCTGERLEVDLVLVGIGIDPNAELANAAGLEVDDGVVVDEFMRSADPHILAIGDVARYPDPDGQGTMRLESTPSAANQAQVAASVVVGSPCASEVDPWFWSEQYDVKLQVAGVSRPSDRTVIRGDPTSGRRLLAFYLRDGMLCAADVAGSPKDFALARKLVRQRVAVAPDVLADEAVPLRSLLSVAAT
jgi:3-phenylpropionate/trans-cinnamate dioxygenase ferredoxin reductase subunit